jgi:hypothetical protein
MHDTPASDDKLYNGSCMSEQMEQSVMVVM